MDWTESHEGQHLHPSQSLPVRPTDLRNRRNLARGVLLVDSESSSPVQGQARRRHCLCLESRAGRVLAQKKLPMPKLVSYIARKTKKVSAHSPSTVGITFANVIPPAPSSALLGTRIRDDDAGSP